MAATLRHGPVDAVRIRGRSVGGADDAPAKECPKCHSVISAGYSICPDCGHEFPREERGTTHQASAGAAGVLKGQVSVTTYPVQEVLYSVHAKRDAPDDAPKTMRVEYRLGFNHYQSEWICFEHTGFARQKAEEWWTRRSGEPVPNTAAQAVEIARAGGLSAPSAIVVRHVAGDDFARIASYVWAQEDESWRAQPEPEYAPADDEIPF